jgi:hypothetical protein
VLVMYGNTACSFLVASGFSICFIVYLYLNQNLK